MKKSHLVVPCLLLLSALAFSACGGSGSSDESKIEEAIETAATGTEPSKCTEVETQAFVEQNTATSGPAAVKECEKEASKAENNAESVTVSNVEVENEEATADVAVTGSSFDGQTLEVALVEEEGQWKLNEFAGFAKLDKAKLVESLEEEFAKSGEVSKSLTACIAEGLEESSQPEIEELILSGSSEGFEELAKECS